MIKSTNDSSNGNPRYALFEFLDTPTVFKATFAKKGMLPHGCYGWGSNKCFKNVSLPNGQHLCDHIWVMAKVWPEVLELEYGDTVLFGAVVGTYQKKGYTDYNFAEIFDPRFTEDFDDALDYCYHYGCTLNGYMPPLDNTEDDLVY